MPRNRQRFSDLDRRLALLNGAAPAPGTDLEAYLQYRTGARKVDIKNNRSSAERVTWGVGVLPFGISAEGTVTAADRYIAPVTRLSDTLRASLGLNDNRLGHAAYDAAMKQNVGFYAALVKVQTTDVTGLTSTDPTPKSAVLNRNYKRTYGRSLVLPFGRTVTAKDAKSGATESTVDAVDEEDVRRSLTSEIKALSGQVTARTVSFEPEKWVRVGRSLGAKPTTT